MIRVTFLVFVIGLLTCRAMGGLGEREVYQPIIDVKPFGEMGTLTEATPQALMEEQKQKEEIAKKFRMCGITDMPDGSRKIAFLDETTKEAQSYVLAVGETKNGFTLVAADYEREYATLEKEGLTFTLGLGKGLIDQPPEVEPESVEVKVEEPVEVKSPRATRLTRSTIPPAKGSYRERLLKRTAAKAEASRKAENAIKEAEAEREKAERRIQIERIKQGLAPTKPITLTPEEDQELQAAGVFDDQNNVGASQPVEDEANEGMEMEREE